MHSAESQILEQQKASHIEELTALLTQRTEAAQPPVTEEKLDDIAILDLCISDEKHAISALEKALMNGINRQPLNPQQTLADLMSEDSTGFTRELVGKRRSEYTIDNDPTAIRTVTDVVSVLQSSDELASGILAFDFDPNLVADGLPVTKYKSERKDSARKRVEYTRKYRFINLLGCEGNDRYDRGNIPGGVAHELGSWVGNNLPRLDNFTNGIPPSQADNVMAGGTHTVEVRGKEYVCQPYKLDSEGGSRVACYIIHERLPQDEFEADRLVVFTVRGAPDEHDALDTAFRDLKSK